MQFVRWMVSYRQCHKLPRLTQANSASALLWRSLYRSTKSGSHRASAAPPFWRSMSHRPTSRSMRRQRKLSEDVQQASGQTQ